MASTAREWWSQRRQLMEKAECGPCAAYFMIPSVKEAASSPSADADHDRKHDKESEKELRLAMARHCTDVGVRAGVVAAAYAALTSSIATLGAVRYVPWANANLNYTAQALFVSAATVATYFIVTEHTILACSRDAAFARLERERAS